MLSGQVFVNCYNFKVKHASIRVQKYRYLALKSKKDSFQGTVSYKTKRSRGQNRSLSRSHNLDWLREVGAEITIFNSATPYRYRYLNTASGCGTLW
jgi:hypothetical protein